MNEKLSSSEQKPEQSPSVESGPKSEPKLPAKIEMDPSTAVARIGQINRNRSMELAHLNAAQAALNVPLTQNSAAISSYDEERQRILSELGSRTISAGRPSGAIGSYEIRQQQAVDKASAERERHLDELLQQVLGERTPVDSQPKRARIENSRPTVAEESVRLPDLSKLVPGDSPDAQQRIESDKQSKSGSLSLRERVQSVRQQAQEMLASMKKMRGIVGDPPKDYAMWAIERGLPFSDTITRLENFLKAPIGSFERASINPTIRQYFLELGPEETIRRAKSASTELLPRVAQNVRDGNLRAVVADMESLDPNYMKAQEKSRAGNAHDLNALDRLLMSQGSNVHEIVRRIEKMNGH